MAKFRDKLCLEQSCEEWFTPSGPAAKYCYSCGMIKAVESQRVNTQNYRIRHGLIDKPGVGSGNNQGLGSDHHSYTSGIGCDFQDKRSNIKDERRYCNRCTKDLLDAGRYFWCLHHIDHDRSNNTKDNLELLCKRCHQIEHDCHRAFESVETIPKGSRASGEVPDGSKR